MRVNAAGLNSHAADNLDRKNKYERGEIAKKSSFSYRRRHAMVCLEKHAESEVIINKKFIFLPKNLNRGRRGLKIGIRGFQIL